jgi:hypothetical protein
MRFGSYSPALLVLCAAVQAQPVLRLKSGHLHANALRSGPERARGSAGLPAVPAGGTSHLILQFSRHPDAAIRTAVENAGMRILAYVPDHGLLVSVPGMVNLGGLNPERIHLLSAADRLSREFDAVSARPDNAAVAAVVEMHPGVGREQAASVLGEAGLAILWNPDLLAHQWLARGTLDQLRALARRDEVAYIYPASRELESGIPVTACLGGAVDGLPAAASLVTAFGEGWDGPGLGGAVLGFFTGSVTQALPAGAFGAEAARAMAEWAGAARLRFNARAGPGQPGTLDMQFIPIDGTGRTLAYAFYPPPNPEPEAGDIHLDIDEPWRLGADVDVFSVLLHEMGHALGLGHNDDPRSVMYPFYRRYDGLHPVDILAIQQLYAAPEPGFGLAPPAAPPENPTNPAPPPSAPPPSAPPPSAPPPATPPPPTPPVPTPPPAAPPTNPESSADRTPPTLTIHTPTTPNSVTAAESIRLGGVASDSGGPVSVTWTNSAGGAGAATGAPGFSAVVPLARGLNRITVTAADPSGNTAWRLFTVTRR